MTREGRAGVFWELSAEFWGSVLCDVRRDIRTFPRQQGWRAGLRDTDAWRELVISTHRWTVAIHSATYEEAHAVAGGWSLGFRFYTPPAQRVSLQVPDEGVAVLPLRAQLFLGDETGIWPIRSIGLLWRSAEDTRRLIRILVRLHEDRRVIGDYDLESGAVSRLVGRERNRDRP